MASRTPAPRHPTVSRPGQVEPRARLRAQPPAASWLRREIVALLGVTGAAITICAELANQMPMAPPFAHALAGWQQTMHALWRPPLQRLGFPLHPHIVAALNAAFFLIVMGIGARISAHLSDKPLTPLTPSRVFDDQTWPSLIVFAALCGVFLFGLGGDPARHRLIVFGSERAGAYVFAIIAATGYFLGDAIGHREFHIRLYRLAALVIALVALNRAAIFVLSSRT